MSETERVLYLLWEDGGADTPQLRQAGHIWGQCMEQGVCLVYLGHVVQ